MSSLTHILQHFFSNKIMSDALDEHDGKVSMASNLRFVNDIDARSEEEQQPEALGESLDKTCTRY